MGRSVQAIWLRWRVLPRLLALLWRVGAHDLVAIVALACVIGFTPLLVVVSLQRLVDAAVAVLQQQSSWQYALGWALALFAANVMQGSLEATNRWRGAVAQERLKLRVQEFVLRKSAHLPLAEFEQATIYDELHRAQRGLDMRLFSTIQQLIPIPTSLVTLIALLGYLGQGHLLLPVVLLLGIVPPALWSTRFLRERYLLERRQTQAERLLAYFTRVITERPAAAEIRLFSLQSHLLESWGRAYQALRGERMRLRQAEAVGLVLRTVAEQLVFGIALTGIVALIALGRISLGAFASYLAAIHRCTEAMYNLLWNIALTIARAYLRDAALLVLDEPTAALDLRAEIEVYRQFRDVAVGRSVVLISHRLGSARLADRILVLVDGHLVEAGSHTALLAAGGRYADLYRVQAGWYR